MDKTVQNANFNVIDFEAKDINFSRFIVSKRLGYTN
ncbi:hypothetical protein RO3G_07646 [Rhizopus delemar RA 99-880]|uniref:Uncharacterized protein n=1 Tax=Rhizopus delemar (strain RA 99-880 / ATCC MYA-4621 / FGSC 9543 / NRRL 43880) TaxID=246409 RepID=I1C3B1_RHIO9|nr:hypothetical protein RO3G_07646 [Rhizopus delemar RA 99-880]|eukprot:EIE82941.1 hypothetical protein RO3G_07646 [Rhizopus delemar RA 99-880]